MKRRNAGAPPSWRLVRRHPAGASTRAFLLLFLLIAGCSFFSRSKSTIYTIEPLPGAQVMSVSGAPLGIGTIELPPGLDRREVVVRRPDHQLEIRGTELWSATLGTMVLHALAFDLASRLPAGMVVLPGTAGPAEMRSIEIAFEEIAAGPEAKVVIDARWNLTHHEHIEVPISALDSANVASGLSQAIALLADRIVAGV